MRFLQGHVSFGPVTMFGRNAMHWAINIRTRRWGYVCFRLPFTCFGCWWPLYLYLSPNATPWASTFYLGDKREAVRAKLRRIAFGHGFNTTANYQELRAINDSRIPASGEEK